MQQTTITKRMRFFAILLAALALLAAMWAGVIRIGWAWNPIQSKWILSHGALMVSGFLGTVIGMERAIALNRLWTFSAPALTVMGALALLLGLPNIIGTILIVLGSIMLVLVFGLILKMQPAIYTGTMAVGAVLWLVGNTVVLFGKPVSLAAGWWMGFLLLTVAGERLELSRVLQLSAKVQNMFIGITAIYVLGLVITLVNISLGGRIAGAGVLLMGVWLMRYDIARRTIKTEGLSKFIAAALLAGYFWLMVSGVLAILYGGQIAGLRYDAILHSLLIGFVISMIFGHAPIIFPAVFGKEIPYTNRFYSHLVLLHISLLLRVGGDLAILPVWRKWGGLLNMIAILLFLVNTITAVRRGTKRLKYD